MHRIVSIALATITMLFGYFHTPSAPPAVDPRQETINALISSMTMEEKVGQLFFARCPKTNAAGLAADYHLGGYILFGRDFKNVIGGWLTKDQITKTIQSYQDAVSIPLLIGVDEEGGTVVRVSSDPKLREEPFRSPQELYRQGGLEAVLTETQEKDVLLASLGINVDLAPVADLSTDPEDFIYERTLGAGTEETCAYIAAVVNKMGGDGMGSVLKHFPGYGDNADTHTGSAVDERPIETFRTGDLLPFQAGIEASSGKTAVLVSHNIVTCIDPDRPASLSPAIYQLLREELGFDGPTLTDDLAMEAIAQYAGTGSPAVLALAAGCDMVISTDFQTQIPQVVAALREGRLSQERIDEALTRVLGWKYDLGLIR